MATPTLPPMPHMPRTELRGFERVSVPLLEAANSRPLVRRGLHSTVGWSFSMVVRAATARRWQVFGIDAVRDMAAPAGIILAANHRSFFDLYVVSTVLKHQTPHMREVAYPVRADFFYTHPVGPVLNLIAAGATMWPPVFRDERRRVLNPLGFQQLARTLGAGCVIGIHPEGTRNKDADPYAYLPRKPGLGQLVLGCAPDVAVLPVFVAGLSNDAPLEVRRSYAADPHRHPIRVHFGQPLRAAALQPLADPAAVVERVFDDVRALGEADRAWMLARG